MATRSSRRDAKADALRADGALHPRPRAVQAPLFASHDFFDPRDLVQVKYEMLRQVDIEGAAVRAVRPAFPRHQTGETPLLEGASADAPDPGLLTPSIIPTGSSSWNTMGSAPWRRSTASTAAASRRRHVYRQLPQPQDEIDHAIRADAAVLDNRSCASRPIGARCSFPARLAAQVCVLVSGGRAGKSFRSRLGRGPSRHNTASLLSSREMLESMKQQSLQSLLVPLHLLRASLTRPRIFRRGSGVCCLSSASRTILPKTGCQPPKCHPRSGRRSCRLFLPQMIQVGTIVDRPQKLSRPLARRAPHERFESYAIASTPNCR